MNVSPDNVPGMGPVKFPSNGNFGSGDIPIAITGIHKYSDYISLINIDSTDDDEIADEISLDEESMLDQIKSNDKNRTPERQYAEYVKMEKAKFNEWKKKRRLYYVDKYKDAKTPEEKKLLKNQFRLETIKKKRLLSEKLKKKRVSKSEKNLKSK